MTFDMAIPGTVLCVFVCRCVRSRYDLTIVAWMVGDEFVMLMAKAVGMVLDGTHTFTKMGYCIYS